MTHMASDMWYTFDTLAHPTGVGKSQKGQLMAPTIMQNSVHVATTVDITC